MKKHRVIVFENGVARVKITRDVDGYTADGKAVFIDPDLSRCRGVSPELWHVVDGKIEPKANSEGLHAERVKIAAALPKSYDKIQDRAIYIVASIAIMAIILSLFGLLSFYKEYTHGWIWN